MRDVFTVTRRLRFADCDPAGIAFYPRLLEHLNGVVEDWCAGPLEYPFRDMHLDRNRGMPTVALSIRFSSPAKLGDMISWHLRVGRLGRSSVTLSVAAFGPDEQDVLHAEPTLVHTDFSRAPPKSEPFPDTVRERIEPFLVT